MYDNSYNRSISNKINDITQQMINHENFLTNTYTHDNKITTRLEGMCIRKKNCYGGSGYAAATVGDHGYAEDKTLGAGVSAAGVSAAGVSAAGKPRRSKKGSGVMDTIGDIAHAVAPFAPMLLAAGKTKKRGGELSLVGLKNLHGQPPFTAPANAKITVSAGPPPPSENFTTRNDRPGSYAGGAKTRSASKAPNARNEIVKKVMKEQGLSLPAASKYVKTHGLY
jgi:hypothetical protein